MEVEYTVFAKASLRNIGLYIIEHFSRKTAEKSVEGIRKAIDRLAFMPYMGQEMHGMFEGLRCLRYKQNSIYYQVFSDKVVIASVWDGRQDPNALIDSILDYFIMERK